MMEGGKNIEDVLALLLCKDSVEIKMEDNGFYEGFVDSFEKHGVFVKFKNRWHCNEFVPFENVRYQRDQPTSQLNVHVGMVVEEYGYNNECLAKAYWKCVVKGMYGSLCSVQYIDRPLRKNIYCVVPLNNLRKPNLKPVFKKKDFEVTCILIRDDYEFYSEEHTEYLKEYLGGAIISYNVLYHAFFIKTPFPKYAKYIACLRKEFLKNLYEKIDRVFETLVLKRHITIASEGGFAGEMHVDKHLLKYVIRPDWNILDNINDMNGISFIQYTKETENFLVFGDTNEIVIQALKLLDYVRNYVYFSPIELSIICEKTRNLEDIKLCCNLTDIYVSDNSVLDDIPECKDKRAVIFVGSTENVMHCKTLLSIFVCYVRQEGHVYNNHWEKFEANVLECRELAKTINIFPNGFTDDSELYGTKHYPLNIWIIRANYRKLLVLDLFLEEQLQIHPISPLLSELISTIYKQLKSIYRLKTPLKPFENESDWSSYTENLTKILSSLGCPKNLTLLGPMKNRLDFNWQKLIAIKFLISELLCAQFTNNRMELRDLKQHLIRSSQRVTRSSILDYLLLPSRPSDKAMKRLIKKLKSI